MPPCSIRRRPNRSPRWPPSSSRPAKTSVYASTTHCSWLVVADRSRLIVGRATLTIVLSTLTNSTDRQRTPRIHQRRSWVLAISSSLTVVVRRSTICGTACYNDRSLSRCLPCRATPRGRTRSQDVEQNLLDAAEAVLVREGLAGVTVRAVATEAGVAPMGVYNRFGSKDGLIEALVMRSFDLLREAVADRGELDPVRAVARIRAALSRVRRQPSAALRGHLHQRRRTAMRRRTRRSRSTPGRRSRPWSRTWSTASRPAPCARATRSTWPSRSGAPCTDPCPWS